MSAGNPHGLSEISHFGGFQRVGGKAGGFINKKFFHPSSLRNQEKLWKAQTADEREVRKQSEMEKRREEERHVEAMRKQLYLAGQGKASDLFVRPGEEAGAEAAEPGKRRSGDKSEQRQALEEERRRKAQVKRSADASEGSSVQVESSMRAMAKSRYQEDVLINGHQQVWGSFFATEGQKWGFACCQGLEHDATCPLAPPPEEREKQGRGSASSSKAAAKEAEEGGEEPAAPGGLQGRGGAGSAGPSGSSDGAGGEAPLMDTRMFAAAERRKQRKLEEEERKRQAKEAAEAAKSSYLGALLANPADTA